MSNIVKIEQIVETCRPQFEMCTNCHEELYINDFQMPEHPISVSDEWRKTVERQREELDSKGESK